MYPTDADGITNSVAPDKTVSLGVCTVCPDLFVRKFRISTLVGMSLLVTGLGSLLDRLTDQLNITLIVLTEQ